jgi:hypothetical protein
VAGAIAIAPAAAGALSGDAPSATGGAHPASSGAAISGIALSSDPDGPALGVEISAAASAGMSHAGEQGVAASADPVTTPNEGGTGTANVASDGASLIGTAVADEMSQGRSALGSGNAGT